MTRSSIKEDSRRARLQENAHSVRLGAFGVDSHKSRMLRIQHEISPVPIVIFNLDSRALLLTEGEKSSGEA